MLDFTIDNFQIRLPFGYESLAFPLHCQHLKKNSIELGWRIIIKTKLRRHWIDTNILGKEESGMFALGENSDYDGLRIPFNIIKDSERPLPIGVHLDMLQETLEENAMVFDRDLGESSYEDTM